MKDRKKVIAKRSQRVRYKLSKVANGKPRLSVYRSLKHILVQVIDDEKSVTVAYASDMEKDLKAKKMQKSEKAKLVGELIAERALKAGIKKVVFDRGGFPYHGRVKSLAEAAKEKGLEF